jgi:AraC-like DNA-binding protein
MINLAQKSADEAAEICLRGELSSAGRTGGIAPEEGGRFGDEIIHLMRLKPADRVQTRAAQRIEASLRYMMQNLNQPMKVPVLSAKVGLSESSFFALFKSATGLTPLDFFIRARMRRAGELLAETTLQIKEVAARLGYDDQFYFSRLFKSVHGVAPREYRARQQQVTHRSGPETMAEEPSPEPGLASAHPSIAPKTYPLTLPNRYLGSQSQPNQACLVPS